MNKKAAIAAEHAELAKLRGRDAGVVEPVHASPPASPATPAVAQPAAPAPRPTPVITAADRADRRRAELLSARPPAGYLAGDREEWRDHVSPSGLVAPGAGRGDW